MSLSLLSCCLFLRYKILSSSSSSSFIHSFILQRPKQMGAEQEHYLPTLLSLFDSLWFEHQILTSTNPATTTESQEGSPENKVSRIPPSIPRSFSDKCLSSRDGLDSEEAEEPSPMSVLLEPKQLQPILSGKEFSGNSDDLGFKNRKSFRRMMRRRKRSSKSLSDLEFKELKGFMDLGFVFSDEDGESELVSIIPGLQKKKKRGVSESGEVSDVPRPYLSEAWAAMEEEEEERDIGSGLGNWRVPAFGNDMEIKNHLRLWAYAVASNVR